MRTLTKKIILTSMLCMSVHATFANETEAKIDPSDITAVNTSGYLGLNNQGDLKLSTSISLTNGGSSSMSMGTLEASIDNQGNYKDSRLQYFQVFSTTNSVAPKVAASIDIIDNQNFTTGALGAVSMVNPGVKNLMGFARVGVLGGKYDSDFTRMMGESDEGIVGGMAAIYLSYKTGEDGTYIMLNPEYTYLDGSIDTSIVKTSLILGTPISSDGKKWAQFKIENSNGHMTSSSQKIDINDTVTWAFFKAYF
jgi:hypothetical protein